MRNKTRKFIWSAPFVAALAIVGALALFGVLAMPNADNAEAQSGDGGEFTSQPAAPTNASGKAGNAVIDIQWTGSSPNGAPDLDGYAILIRANTVGTWLTSGALTTGVTQKAVVSASTDDYQVTGLDNSATAPYNVGIVPVLLDADGAVTDYGTNVATVIDGVDANDTDFDPNAVAPKKVTGISLQQTGDKTTNNNGTADNTADDFDEAKVTVTWTAPTDMGGADFLGYVVQASTTSATTFQDFDEVEDAATALKEDTAQFSVDTTEEVTLRNGGVVRITPVNTVTLGGDADLDNTDLNAEQRQTSSAFVLKSTPAYDVKSENFTYTVSSSSTSANAGADLTVKFTSLNTPLAVGSSIVLYLEDDYVEPSSIPASSVFFVADNEASQATGNGARVYATHAPTIKNDAYITADKKDIAVRVLIPDMCTNATDVCEGDNGPEKGQDLTMVIMGATSGIKNPSEQDSHSVYVDVLGPADRPETAGTIRDRVKAIKDMMPLTGDPALTSANDTDDSELATLAKIVPSSVDGKRGSELTVKGTGFNDGKSAAAYVLALPAADNKSKWNSLSPALQMAALGPAPAAGATDTRFSGAYDTLTTAQKAIVDGSKFFTEGLGEAAFCQGIIATGTRAGAGTVGADDIVNVTFEVAVPTFMPGNVNYICMVDGEGRTSGSDVEDYKLKPSITVSPTTANVGDTVTIFAQDFPANVINHDWLKLAGQSEGGPLGRDFQTLIGPISAVDGSASGTFVVPSFLEGTVKVEAAWQKFEADGTTRAKADDGKDAVEKADTSLTIIGSSLSISKAEALPNELLTITGDGFGGDNVAKAKITIDGVPLEIHKDSLNSDDMVDVSSAGQFVATVILWPDSSTATNPTLTAGVHTIDVEDDAGFSGSVTVTIPAPTVKVTPAAAGPRDVVTISGENWPVENLDGGNIEAVTIDVTDGARKRTYSVYPDGAGRFFQEHQVHSGVTIPSTSRVEATYDDTLVKLTSYEVPEAVIDINPMSAQPGDQLTLSVDKMPVYAKVSSVQIASREVIPVGNFSTDRTGSVTVDGVVVPGLDPGIYSVLMRVGDTVAIGSVEVLSEGPIGTEQAVADATAPLGDSLSAVFFFDNISKSWSFYDPRPEFAELNTLNNLVNGQAYWVLVTDNVDDVVLNNKSRSLSCSNGDCWNLVIW